MRWVSWQLKSPAIRLFVQANNEGNIKAQHYSSPLDKMAASSQITSFKYILMNEKFFFISIQIPLKFVANGPIDNFAVLVQVMAWCWTREKPLPEPMLTQFTDIYVTLGGDELKGLVRGIHWWLVDSLTNFDGQSDHSAHWDHWYNMVYLM